MYKVRKRDGKIVGFEVEKIKSALNKAFDSENVNIDEFESHNKNFLEI